MIISQIKVKRIRFLPIFWSARFWDTARDAISVYEPIIIWLSLVLLSVTVWLVWPRTTAILSKIEFSFLEWISNVHFVVVKPRMVYTFSERFSFQGFLTNGLNVMTFSIFVYFVFFFNFPVCSCNFEVTLDKHFKFVGISVLMVLKIN